MAGGQPPTVGWNVHEGFSISIDALSKSGGIHGRKESALCEVVRTKVEVAEKNKQQN